ncbi:Hydrolase, alpha/beta fold family [Brevundimonas diminuta 3F5N]|uniref:Hydrolase, alpha/beta fold family n=1 Tax=Brevundimonas diminuta 3F5N TaxID=1255603 RepID=A0A1R4G7Y1_BREDI|nr:alpha/beta fold hydrolase [Brevundimonas diminuta]SJM64167.1 Hydrolase, alpha/beta fold family [Brevundimonas diminuta 3F5N]
MLTLAAALLLSPVSTPVELASTPAALQGTLLMPEGQMRAAAVIIAGSGPTDRDGNSPVGVTGGVYHQLAEGLAERGIATVRFDKRGIAASAPAATGEANLTFDTFIDDAKAWARQTAQKTGAPCVWLIGHSEGALIAQAAAADNPGVCGLVLLSPVGVRANIELRRQLEPKLPPTVKPEVDHILSELEAGRTVMETPPYLAALFRPSIQPYLISYFVVDPQALIAAYDRPVLLGHGSTDIQVVPANSETLLAAQPKAERIVFEGLNHILRQAPADPAGNAATYGDASIPLGAEVVPAVADFILKAR